MARFEVLTVMLAKITEFSDITPYQVTKSYRRFERRFCSHLQCHQSNKSVSSFTARLWMYAQISTRCKTQKIWNFLFYIV